MDKPWNGKCPSCKNVKAYQSCFSWLCPNMDCKYYDSAQLDLVMEYGIQEEEVNKGASKVSDEPEIPFEERDTIPYYPTGAGGVVCTAPSQLDDNDPDDWTDLLDPPLFLKIKSWT